MTSKKATFGRSLKSDFLLDPKYIPLNHGSFGTYPRQLQAVFRKYQDEAEAHPDRFNRLELAPLLRQNRERIAKVIGCPDPADLAFVQNASTGVGTVLRSFPFEKGDKVLCYSVAYVNVARCLNYLSDRGIVELIPIELRYPLNNQEIIEITRETIERKQAEGGSGCIRMAVIDAISALPGVRFPFEAIVRLVQDYGILALVDGAHTIGQIELNMEELNPDFFVGNLHKWFYTPRGCCVLYVPKRNQRYVHPSTINHAYKSGDDPAFSFEKEFETLGAYDHSPFLCIGAAIDYRQALGGESAIMEYCHNLAVEGGALVAEYLGTSVMENPERTLTAAMVNVELPLTKSRLDDDAETANYFIKTMIYEHNCMAPVYKHNGKWWVRLSAQIYNDLEDFKYGAQVLQKICQDLQV